MKGKTRYKENRYAYLKTRNTINLVTLVMVGEFGSKVFTNPLGNKLDPVWCIPWYTSQFFQVPKFPAVLRTPHFPLGIQTFLVLFMVEIISFSTQMRLAPFPLLACLLALMTITFLFFFFLWCSHLFVHLFYLGVKNFACWLFLLFSPVFALYW